MTFTMSFDGSRDTITTTNVDEYTNLLEYYRNKGIAVTVVVSE